MADMKFDQKKLSFSAGSGISFTKLSKALANMDMGFLKAQEKLHVYTSELDRGRNDLKVIKDKNKDLELLIKENKKEINSLATKISSIRTKLEVTIISANASKADMEENKVKCQELQVEVARLEERFTAATTELDRMRDPANPESNMSMKRHLTNDRKEMKRLRAEIENVRMHNAKLLEEIQARDEEINTLHSKVNSRQEENKSLEEELELADKNTEEEKELKLELYSKYAALQKERLSYDDKLKTVKIRLGMTEAGRSVSEKVAADLKGTTSKLQKEGAYLERKLREMNAELNALKSKENYTKTANSIQGHTYRIQGKVKAIDLRGRLGNLGTLLEQKTNSKLSSRSMDGGESTRSKVADSKTARSSFSDVGVKVARKGGSSRQSVAVPTLRYQDGGSISTLNRSPSVKTNFSKDTRKHSVSFVPPKK